MTKIYQGAGVTEYHLNSGQILTLTEDDFKELLGAEDINELQDGFDLYKDCEDELSLFDDILKKLESDKDNLKEIISSKTELINYLYKWIEDES